ncbi:MAG: SMC-Scp complex subunit ScpB [Gammaproteobacteria bacterium]|nr:MAG: SMC-Scp complex subunit ScpB [Gammaproteobacteria bacterium]
MDTDKLKQIAEAVLLAAGRPLTLDQLLAMFPEAERPERADMRKALSALEADFESRGIQLVQVASGYRVQVREEMQPWVSRLWEEKPSRYSRALLETLALIAYRQPITRGEIEEVRGVSVSTSIMRTLLEREWVRAVGHRDVPGHPAMYGTTRQFLDYFNLKSLDELPTLAELRDLSTIGAELELDLSDIPGLQAESANDDGEDTADTRDEVTDTGETGALPATDVNGDESGTGTEVTSTLH